MLMNRRTCPLSSRKCCVIAGCLLPRLSSSPGRFAPSHSIFPAPSVNRRSALGISTVTFITTSPSHDLSKPTALQNTATKHDSKQGSENSSQIPELSFRTPSGVRNPLLLLPLLLLLGGKGFSPAITPSS